MFDAEHGTNTTGIVWWTNPRSKNFASGIRYEPCAPHFCELAIQRAEIDPKEYCFVDIGCGKGRPLIIASKLGFKELIGVEYSAALCRAAKRNLKICGVEAQVINADATDVAYPAANIFAFFYHPFHDDVLSIVLEKLRAATARGDLVIAYVGESDLIANREWLQQMGDYPSLRLFKKSVKLKPKSAINVPAGTLRAQALLFLCCLFDIVGSQCGFAEALVA